MSGLSLASQTLSSQPDAPLPGELVALKRRLHAQFVADADASRLSRLSLAALAEQVGALAARLLLEEDRALTGRQRAGLVQAVLYELVGLGPLEPLLQDATVSEIMVNGASQVYVERRGRLTRTEVTFDDDAHLRRIIERIVSPLGRRVDESSPMVDARLPDGSRVNIILPPLAVHGPVLTIRKFAQQPLTMPDLVRLETLTPQAAAFLRVCVMGQLNILVSGGTGSGKTTTLNALSSFIPSDERIITIEDAAELQLQQAHVVTLESRPPNLEGRGEITIRHLVRNALRMRPDRLILGEVRGSEALDLLMALNTGHDGSLSTIHANGPRDALARLETMTLMAGTELPLRAVREQVASAVQIVLHQERARDGRRRITHISEITGLSGDILSLQEIFRWDTAHNALCATGIRPACASSLSSEWLL
jgi:pilus assembly protein CpaF